MANNKIMKSVKLREGNRAQNRPAVRYPLLVVQPGEHLSAADPSVAPVAMLAATLAQSECLSPTVP